MTENNKKSTEAQKTDHRSTPKAPAFTEFIAKDWAKAEDSGYTRERVADYAAERRAKISKAFPGERLVLPEGPFERLRLPFPPALGVCAPDRFGYRP